MAYDLRKAPGRRDQYHQIVPFVLKHGKHRREGGGGQRSWPLGQVAGDREQIFGF